MGVAGHRTSIAAKADWSKADLGRFMPAQLYALLLEGPDVFAKALGLTAKDVAEARWLWLTATVNADGTLQQAPVTLGLALTGQPCSSPFLRSRCAMRGCARQNCTQCFSIKDQAPASVIEHWLSMGTQLHLVHELILHS